MSRSTSGTRPANRTDRARKMRNVQTETTKDPAALRWRTYGYAVLVMVVLFLTGCSRGVAASPGGGRDDDARAPGIRRFPQRVHDDPRQPHSLLRGRQRGPVVLVHGLGSRAEDWANLMPQLKQAGFHVYAIDLLGYGRSARPADAAYSISGRGWQYVEDFLAQRGLEKVNLVGWSMGGWVSMRVALDQPERIGRLVLCGSAGIRFEPTFTVFDFEPTTIPAVQHLYSLLMPRPAAVPDFLARDMVRKFKGLNWVVDRSARSMFHGDDLLDGKLGALQMPTLIIWGGRTTSFRWPRASRCMRRSRNLSSRYMTAAVTWRLASAPVVIGPRLIDFLDGKPPQTKETTAIGLN